MWQYLSKKSMVRFPLQSIVIWYVHQFPICFFSNIYCIYIYCVYKYTVYIYILNIYIYINIYSIYIYVYLISTFNTSIVFLYCLAFFISFQGRFFSPTAWPQAAKRSIATGTGGWCVERHSAMPGRGWSKIPIGWFWIPIFCCKESNYRIFLCIKHMLYIHACMHRCIQTYVHLHLDR